MCTCNRPSDIARVTRSLLLGNDRAIQLIVVDQSDDDSTERILSGPEFTGHVQYVRSATRGKGAAMNEGIRLATSPFIVCTDDDCEAPPGWVEGMAELLVGADRVAVAFCRVEAPPHDRSAGYVPVYLPARRRLMRSALATCAHRGIGAGHGAPSGGGAGARRDGRVARPRALAFPRVTTGTSRSARS